MLRLTDLKANLNKKRLTTLANIVIDGGLPAPVLNFVASVKHPTSPLHVLANTADNSHFRR
jgi:PKD repeat protein